MKSLILKSFTALSLLLGAGLANAQTPQSVDMSLTGSPSNGGVYPGYVYAATLNATFFSGFTFNLPANAVWLQFTVPTGAEFDLTYPGIPAGWSYNYSDPHNIYLENTLDVNLLSSVVFAIPFKVVAAIPTPGAGVYNTTGQIMIANANFTDPATNNNVVTTTISVLNTPLPLQFVSFEVKANNCKSDVKWVTAGEKNNSYFEVERSADGEHFAAIGRVKSAGNTNGETEYTFVDESPVKGHNFYRIRQVDADDKSTTSAIQQVLFDCAVNAIEMYPNPSTGIIYVKGLKDKAVIEVMNVAGQKVLSKEAQNSLEGVNLTGLADGTYQVNVVNANKQIVFTAKLVKK